MAYRHPNAPDPLADLARLREDVEVLKRSLGTVRGPMVFQDANGAVRVRVGPLPSGGYGVEVYDETGAVTWRS